MEREYEYQTGDLAGAWGILNSLCCIAGLREGFNAVGYQALGRARRHLEDRAAASLRACGEDEGGGRIASALHSAFRAGMDHGMSAMMRGAR